MADATKISSTSIKTGPAGSIKTDSENLAVATKKEHAKVEAAAKKVEVGEGEVAYKTMGVNDFSVGAIKFGCSRYVTGDKKEQELLDSCVARKLLIVEEDKR